MPEYALRLTSEQHQILRTHLMPADGCEAVALALCGRSTGDERHVFIARQIVTVPYSSCSVRTPDSVTWPTETVEPLVREAFGRGQAIIKFHSHRSDYRQFSSTDDQSDELLFTSISSLLGDGLPHASIIMLPDGGYIGRAVKDGVDFEPLAMISVIGDNIAIGTRHRMTRGTTGWQAQPASVWQRHHYASTKAVRRRSGLFRNRESRRRTARPLRDRQARLVDPDFVEEKNLNRILNTWEGRRYLGKPKVFALASAIARMGLGQEVLPLQ